MSIMLIVLKLIGLYIGITYSISNICNFIRGSEIKGLYVGLQTLGLLVFIIIQFKLYM